MLVDHPRVPTPRRLPSFLPLLGARFTNSPAMTKTLGGEPQMGVSLVGQIYFRKIENQTWERVCKRVHPLFRVFLFRFFTFELVKSNVVFCSFVRASARRLFEYADQPTAESKLRDLV